MNGLARRELQRTSSIPTIAVTAASCRFTEDEEEELAEGRRQSLAEAVEALQECFKYERLVDVVRRCGKARSLWQGRRAHECAAARGVVAGDRFLANLLVWMYGQCGCPSEAAAVFVGIQRKNSFSWNIMVAAYAECGQLQEAKELFDASPKRNAVSWNCILSSYGRWQQVADATDAFERMPARDVLSWTAMLTAHAQQGNLQEARRLFHRMPERSVVSWNALLTAHAINGDAGGARCVFDEAPGRNACSWNAMLHGYAQNGQLQAASRAFERMPARDMVAWTAMLTALARCGRLEAAEQLFLGGGMPARSLVSWNAMVQAYLDNGRIDDAVRLLSLLPGDDVVSHTAVIQALGGAGRVECARRLFDGMRRRDVHAWSSMVAAYANNGRLEEARALFDGGGGGNAIAWNGMITAYAHAGRLRDTLALLALMDAQGVKPNEVSYVVALDACAGGGAGAEGRLVAAAMVESGIRTGVVAQTALLNMYGACGKLGEAKQTFDAMQERNTISWNALLAAYAHHGRSDAVLELFGAMAHDGAAQADGATFISVLAACSHGGLLQLGRRHFCSMAPDYAVGAGTEHYSCLVDLLGRAGQLTDAEQLLLRQPFQPAQDTAWLSLLASCSCHGDATRGARAASRLLSVPASTSAPYLLLQLLDQTIGAGAPIPQIAG